MTDMTALSRRSFIMMSLALAACKPGAKTLNFSGLTMGTSYNIVAVDPSRKVDEAEAKAQIESALALVNKQMSNWDSSSEISQFNAKTDLGAMQVSADLAKVMRAAEDVHIASEGRFDTTMGPLIELWGFGANGAKHMATDAEIAQAQARSGHGATLNVGATSLQKRRSDAQVYLSAIGKGYGADQVGQALQALGINDYMVEIGGDLYASGNNPNGLPWQIGIESPDPAARGVMQAVGISGMGLASSGDYRNFFEADGQRFSHLIDPATGRPVDHNTASATVLAENAMLADAWSTAMLILGRERGMEIAAEHNIAVHFVDRPVAGTQIGFKVFQSEAFKSLTT